jgi:hypothetical protein
MIQHLFRLPTLVALSLFVAIGAGGRGATAGGSCGGQYDGPLMSMDGAQVGAATAIAGADVLVGAPGIGSVAVYRRIEGVYSVLQRPSSIPAQSSGFGRDIAVDGTVAAVSAPFHNNSQGAVVLYSRASGGTWSILQEINSPHPANGVFGMSVAMSNGFLAIGAPGFINASGVARGAVYLYERAPAGTYSLVRQFDPVEAMSAQAKWFGWGVGLGNSTLVVAAPGESLAGEIGKLGTMYVYRRDDLGSWNTPLRMKSPGTSGGTFGTALAVGTESTSGAGVSIFMREQRPTRPDTVWMYSTVLSVPSLNIGFEASATPAFVGDPLTDCVLTNSLAIHEGFGLVGSPKYSAVTRFIYSGTAWTPDDSETYPGGGVSSQWGQSVAVGHDHVAIGAPYYDYGSNREFGFVSIRTHDSPKCDGVGVDACVIALAGSSVADLNSDGVPDACQTVTAPTVVTATEGTRTDGVALVWPTVDRAVRYKISLLTGTDETDVGYAYVAQYIDTAATAGVLRTYRVRSESAGGVLSSGFATNTKGWRMLATPTSVAATDGTSTTGVTLTWNAVLGATTYEIYRSTSSTVPIATVSSLTYVDTSATPAGVSFAYSVRAKCTLGVSGFSEANVGWIAANASPLTLAATDGTSSSNVTLTWTVPTGGSSAYTILRGEGSKKPKVIGTVGAGVLTYVDSAVPKAGKAYKYVVRISTATNGGRQDVGWKATVGPSAVVATDGTLQNGVRLTWALAPKSSKASRYVVYRAATGGSPLLIASLGKKVITYLDTTAIPGSSYTYSVRASGSLGLSMPGSDTGWRPLAAPTSLSASDNLPDRVALTWTESRGATSYRVTRTASGTSVELNAGVNNYNDTSAVAGIIYTYTVQAVCTLGLSPSSASDTGTRVSSFRMLLAGGGAAAGGSGDSSGRVSTGSDTPEEMEASTDDETSADHTWLIDGVKIENGPFVMNHHDAMVVQLRDPASAEDASMLVLLGEGFLDGTLRVAFDDYQPSIGDEWTVILSGGLVGDFRRVLLPALPEGMSMETERVGTIYQVRVIATPE